MSKNNKNSNNTNTIKKKKIEQKENNKNQLNNNKNANTSNRIIVDNENKIEKNIVIRRSTGREEKYDTNRLAQTSSRSGIPFAMAKDISNITTEKVQNNIKNKKSDKKLQMSI
jgi:hypothetical protein